MKTLLLHAPKDKDAASGLHKAFDSILTNHKGPDYAIYGNLTGQISTGMKVVVFDRAGHRQAEGIVAGLNPTGHKTATGVLRYDVLIRGLSEVPYTNPQRVNRCGIGFAV